MLEVTDLRSGYGRIPVLNGIDFSLAPGARVGILGHNGMGKTTFMRTLTGLVAAWSGDIALDGRSIVGKKTHERARLGLAHVLQGRQIFPQLSVIENLRMGALRTSGAAIERVLELIPRLKPLLSRPGGALSGGEQQILAIARAVCSAPRVLLLDEPTEGIQPSIVHEIGELLLELNRTEALSVVVVEQNLDFIVAVTERVAVLQKGVIVRQVAPDRLHDQEFVAEFVGMTG